MTTTLPERCGLPGDAEYGRWPEPPGFLSAYPIWSVIVIALDVFVIFALTARWAEARAAM